MKHAVTKPSNSTSGLSKSKAKSKNGVKKAVEATSKNPKQIKPASKTSKLKTGINKPSRKKEIAVKPKIAKSLLGKKSVLKIKLVNPATSKNTAKAAVSAKKAALPKSDKKAVLNSKTDVLKPKKLVNKVSSKTTTKTKPETAKKRISTINKSAKSVQEKAGNVKAIGSKSKAKSQLVIRKKSAQTTKLSESKAANKSIAGNQKANLNRTKPNGKTVAVKKVLLSANSKIVAKTISTVKKANIKSKPEKKSGAIPKKPQNKTVKSAGKVLVGKKNKVEKSVKKINSVKKTTNSAPAEIKKPRKKPVRPISSAVFRGKKSLYDFKVFSIDEKFEPVQAVYIISRRVTDRRKRGHHKLICIGQTDSVSEGIKMHKKGKCIRQNEANVICLLKEDDEKNRLRIEADLREAHSVSCNQR